MKVIDERAPSSIRKLAGLSYEDFLEALCRIALQKAWPERDALALSGCKDALDYLADVRMNDLKTHTELMQTRAVPWNCEPLLPPRECVAHLCTGIVRIVEESVAGSTGSTPNGRVSNKDAEEFRRNTAPRGRRTGR